jgi:ankyrin repeat protein
MTMLKQTFSQNPASDISSNEEDKDDNHILIEKIFNIQLKEPVLDVDTYEKIYNSFEKEDRLASNNSYRIPQKLLDLVAEKVNFNVVNGDNETILFEAAYGNQGELVHFFLDNGVNINHVNNERLNALWAAMINKSYNSFEALLDRGILVPPPPNFDVLEYICREKDHTLLRLYCEAAEKRKKIIRKSKQQEVIRRWQDERDQIKNCAIL